MEVFNRSTGLVFNLTHGYFFILFSYCHYGAKYIRDNRQHLVDRYNHQAFKIAERLGRNGVAIFLIEPDFW